MLASRRIDLHVLNDGNCIHRHCLKVKPHTDRPSIAQDIHPTQWKQKNVKMLFILTDTAAAMEECKKLNLSQDCKLVLRFSYHVAYVDLAQSQSKMQHFYSAN